MPVNARDQEAGFTMIATVIAMSVIVLLAAVAVTAVNGDANLTHRDYESKQAYEAARAGVEDYAFHLDANGSYWEGCANVPAPSAVNQVGSTANRRAVPGSTTAEYAIELLPSTSQSTYGECSTANPAASMLEPSDNLTGAFRIRSVGFSGKARSSIVATFRRPSFLDYVYFTQFETLDPILYAQPEWLKSAYEHCETTIVEGREKTPIPNSGNRYCSIISFATGDEQQGPVHTNDSFVICGKPVFGRNASDVIEASGGPPAFFAGDSSQLGPTAPGCSSSGPVMKGNLKEISSSIEPPATNGALATIAEPRFRYTGQVRICLTGGTAMSVGNDGGCTNLYQGAIPSNGVIYVSSGAGCSSTYTPFTAEYPTTSACGNALVQGSYSGQLTIAAENDIIITDDLVREPSSDGLLGLIANNFVRVYHSYPNEGLSDTSHQPSCSRYSGKGSESGLGNVTIDAAILAIKHSFIVDHYDCGSNQGTLTVNGAIAQKFRGPVGTFQTGRNGQTTTVSGYSKKYEYDDRLRYEEPPNFLDPVSKSWVVGRETVG